MYKLTILWVNSDNNLCCSHVQVNSKQKEKAKKPIEILPRHMFYYNDDVKHTASVKPTNKLNINKHIFLLLYLK